MKVRAKSNDSEMEELIASLQMEVQQVIQESAQILPKTMRRVTMNYYGRSRRSSGEKMVEVGKDNDMLPYYRHRELPSSIRS